MSKGCPVGYDSLSYLRIRHWDFGGNPQWGELVVHNRVAPAIVQVFRELFNDHIQIRLMVLVDDFGKGDGPKSGADDFSSIESDNTSAFNCRERSGSSGAFSQHAYGLAIDINPLENPYVARDGTTAHRRSIPYLRRSSGAAHMIAGDGPVVAAFARIGWKWGGYWNTKDYQHFSENGR